MLPFRFYLQNFFGGIILQSRHCKIGRFCTFIEYIIYNVYLCRIRALLITRNRHLFAVLRMYI